MFGKEVRIARLHARKEAVLQRIQTSDPGRPTRQPAHRIRIVSAVAAIVGLFATGIVTGAGAAPIAGKAPVGQGLTVTPSDLAFILKQIKIAEHHAATATPANLCGTLVGPGPDQIPDYLTAYGLRTVDGSCNNLIPQQPGVDADPNTPGATRPRFASADQPFPRLASPGVFRPAEDITAALPVGPLGPTTYAQKKGVVVDSQPRVISDLIVDQTATNPAAIAAAAFPVRSQSAGPSNVFPCDPGGDPSAINLTGTPAGCTASTDSLFIPNVTTDVGLSPPYNSLFTFFGQFFDHGVDQTVKSGGTVFVPLHADDELITVGPDGIANTGDEVTDPNKQFMVLTRAQNQPGPDGILGDNPATPAVDESADDIQNANITDTPWVDQSQTYTSHPSHQVFLREYVLNAAGRPVSTGKLLGGLAAGATYPGSPDGTTGIGTWAAVKLQAANNLGLLLQDKDVTNIPMIATDPYGKFIPGPARGLPQYVTTAGLVEGDRAAPVLVPSTVLHFDTPFLTDIAHNADPGTVGPCTTTGNAAGCLEPDSESPAAPSANFAAQPPGTYDDEMLNAHFVCGDGRCNENIALSTIHQIFHSEHDRLVDYIKGVLTNDTTASGVAALPQWQLPTAQNPAGWNGERLFQAARFVTEMEYQHLVFEEFGRKIQPAIRPFHVYNADINAAIPAEFAHAVYRFGHSMLDDVVARTNEDGSDNSLPLLTAFLNPPEFFDGGTVGTLTPEQAAGSVVMGSSDQVGNELDEFIVKTLRSNLLGLPLDLATLNMTRARDAGIPPLNQLRRQLFAKTNDGQLKPYTSWADYGQHLKHPESLINFVAAYGTHLSITGVTAMADKRAAATALVAASDPASLTFSQDAADFMNSAGPWVNDANGLTTTGLDSVDLWVGGLAEVTNLFGGLLGTTFNYVFQSSMENLQDGDRLYYLNRTPGMNLRTQLEGNSFSELIMRNTDGTNTLKADAFATADCKFQLGNLAGTQAGFTSFGATVANDPTTLDCNESQLLLRKPDGTIQYRQINTVDPSGINGQSVYNGTPGVDRVWGGNDNDTFWGNAGNDVIEGGNGDDIALGGDGNDIITDSGGADVEKGGPGNDALDGGPGNDNFMGGDGQDFINGGANDNEAFAGPGNDFIIAGQGTDAVLGDGGDDWIQGGSGQDLLIGDHSAPFFDDPAQVAPGNDVFVGQVGENDYDAEGGDDLMAQNAAIDRNAGAAGFDWAFHQYNTVPAVDDMMINNNLVGVPIQVVVNRDRWQETEGDSGAGFNDNLKGTILAPSAIGGAGFAGCDVIDQAGLDRIPGLDPLVPVLTLDPTLPGGVIANSVAKYCPVSGNVWGDGDILIGGRGSDTIEGRGANDVIDGDRYLEVRIGVTGQTGETDLMEHASLTAGTFGPGTIGMTLQQAVFAGLVDPGNLFIIRRIVTPTDLINCGVVTVGSPANCDTAVFSGPVGNYTIAPHAADLLGNLAYTEVTDNVGTDGSDVVRNVENLQFTDTTVSLVPTPAASITAASLTFNNQNTGTTSAARAITVTNSGTAPLSVSGVTLGGTDAGEFVITNNLCASPVTVSPGFSCEIFVAFAPTSAGSKTATVTISHNAAGSPSVLTLTGTGLTPAPVASVSGALAFGNQTTATTSATQAITLTNTGTADLVVPAGGVALTGTNANQFAIAGNTCTTIAPAANCTVTVQFSPTTAGAKTASVSIAHNAVGSPTLVGLTGTGVTPGAPATATATVADVAFGTVRRGVVRTRTAVVTNTGTASLTITAATTTAPFGVTLGTCNVAVAPGRTCKLDVTFAPTTATATTRTLTLTSNATNSPTATLTGTGR